jgi:hypothetical protein
MPLMCICIKICIWDVSFDGWVELFTKIHRHDFQCENELTSLQYIFVLEIHISAFSAHIGQKINKNYYGLEEEGR